MRTSDTITALIISRAWNMCKANYRQILIRDEIAYKLNLKINYLWQPQNGKIIW
jgi:hypothetical protein